MPSRPPDGQDVAVVIVNWNTRDLLKACLTSLSESVHRRLRRVIVVDNASADGSASLVQQEFPQVELIQPGWNSGYAAGNNLGLRATAEPYLLLLNPDTEVRPGVLEVLAEFLDTHASCGAVAPQLYSPDGSVQRSCRSFPFPLALAAELFGLSRFSGIFPRLGAYRMAGWDHDSERMVDQPMGSALMLRREAIDQVGLMDEQFPLFFNEVDWLYRIRRAGWEIWFTPRAGILHHLGSSTRQVRVRAAWLSHTGLHAFYRKHFRSTLPPVVYSFMVAAIYLHAALTVAWRLLEQWLRNFVLAPCHQP